MKKTIVIYYSNNGSNKFLANKIANELNCPIEELKPFPKNYLILLTGLIFWNKKVSNDINLFDRVILCGPIWMGRFIAPLRLFVKKNSTKIRELVFISCCGSRTDKKYEKFGHGLVFQKLQKKYPEKCSYCEAFPITMVLPEEKWEEGEIVMKTRLNEANFKGEILDHFNTMIKKLLV